MCAPGSMRLSITRKGAPVMPGSRDINTPLQVAHTRAQKKMKKIRSPFSPLEIRAAEIIPHKNDSGGSHSRGH